MPFQIHVFFLKTEKAVKEYHSALVAKLVLLLLLLVVVMKLSFWHVCKVCYW